MITLTDTDEGLILSIKVVPGSSKTCLAGPIGSMLKVKVAAAPEKGKANECLIAYLAQLLGIRKNAVEILSGQTSPVKQVRISGLKSDAVRGILEAQCSQKKNNTHVE